MKKKLTKLYFFYQPWDVVVKNTLILLKISPQWKMSMWTSEIQKLDRWVPVMKTKIFKEFHSSLPIYWNYDIQKYC